ncbi:response regulator receiver modulated metal dependent phosphohydrolase [Candidatus Magnetobacterium bavaricum]|uniref:Response regulator receiver modulated metal dependent phosphohydrolase n=1 Tax=Candidatus Magnetobacterium bavaricum TaxID=29290 RepID=A0A0F3GZG2_9BACT|nr:response regulator receiver modulated metal dependent phosphohydrolase [Candidatus Magnetobacterium bavaricum]
MIDKGKAHILVTDDDPFVRESVSVLLTENCYNVMTCSNAREALDLMTTHHDVISVVLTDINMPGISGVGLLGRLHKLYPDIPVILMTAFAELDVVIDAIKKGAYDFIIKPYRYEQLFYSVDKAVRYSQLLRMEKDYTRRLEDTVRQRTRELSDALEKVTSLSNDIVNRLTVTAEYRDEDTGSHILRIGKYAEVLAHALGMSEEFICSIRFASPLHDIGKIGIPDSILLKPSGLTPEEFQVMKTHTSIGAKILSGSSFLKLKMAQSIAQSHHERWDGSGYPKGLRSTAIGIDARIAIICDQYDALRSKRPYKSALTHEDTVKIITVGDGRTKPSHFDPHVLRAFKQITGRFNDIFDTHQF